MIFEKLGKMIFSKKRMFLFYLVISLPVFFGLVFALKKYGEISSLEERFSIACKKGKTAIERKQKKEEFIQKYSGANPYFLDEKIESMVFLQSEIRELENLIHHPAISDKRAFFSRLDFLKNGANSLSFIEESIRSNSHIKETEEKQRHIVEMNGEDVKILLSKLENLPIEGFESTSNRPQIVITDFRLEKRKSSVKTENYEIDMQFLKREFT